MPKNYIVRPGDTLGKIAASNGFRNFREIYDDPANAAFRAKRPNPDLIFPGDLIVIPDRGTGPPSPVVPPVVPPVPAPAADPRQEALNQRGEPTLWVSKSFMALQNFQQFLRLGVDDFLHVHELTREALRVHFHMDGPEQSPLELDFIARRFGDILKLLTSEADAQYHSATPEQEQKMIAARADHGLPMAVTDNRFLGQQGILFTSSFLQVSVNCRKLILIHEGLHFVDPKPLGPNIVDIGEGDAKYDDPSFLPLEKAIHNPSSYAAGAWHLANGADGARHFCG
jgi:hypothetical protein